VTIDALARLAQLNRAYLIRAFTKMDRVRGRF
jgi:hypothetical protein